MKSKIIAEAIFVSALLATVATLEVDWANIEDSNIYVDPTGEASSVARIIGGTEASPNAIPYQAALFIKTGRGTAFCGGSLISENYVLTAAHCTESADSVIVILGAHDLKKNESDKIEYKCDTILVHPNWNRKTLQNDISLVKLPNPVKLSDKIATISLADSGSFSDAKALLSGWGKTSDESRTSHVLNQVDLSVLENRECGNFFEGIMQDSHVCTSGVEIKGGCNGDSGGPLVVDNQQIGVVSFGSNKCTKGYPTVFTRVSEFMGWIEEHSDLGSVLD